jgi:hypothetical protein
MMIVLAFMNSALCTTCTIYTQCTFMQSSTYIIDMSVSLCRLKPTYQHPMSADKQPSPFPPRTPPLLALHGHLAAHSLCTGRRSPCTTFRPTSPYHPSFPLLTRPVLCPAMSSKPFPPRAAPALCPTRSLAQHCHPSYSS